jgi:hypothetical protein
MTTSIAEAPALTDDELMALANRAGKVWPTAVPTVDRADRRSIEISVARGARSLMARQLLAPEREWLAPSVETLVKLIINGRAMLGTYVATDQLRYFPSFPATAYYECGEGTWLSETITPLGIHYFVVEKMKDCRDAVWAVIERTRADGVAQAPDGRAEGMRAVRPEFLCVAGPSDHKPVRIVAVRRSEILPVQVSPDKVPTLSPASLVDASAAMEYLFSK